MLPHEVVNWLVPCSPIRSDTRTIPPFGVKFSITKPHQFRQSVQDRLEDRKESRQPDDEGDG